MSIARAPRTFKACVRAHLHLPLVVVLMEAALRPVDRQVPLGVRIAEQLRLQQLMIDEVDACMHDNDHIRKRACGHVAVLHVPLVQIYYCNTDLRTTITETFVSFHWSESLPAEAGLASVAQVSAVQLGYGVWLQHILICALHSAAWRATAVTKHA